MAMLNNQRISLEKIDIWSLWSLPVANEPRTDLLGFALHLGSPIRPQVIALTVETWGPVVKAFQDRFIHFLGPIYIYIYIVYTWYVCIYIWYIYIYIIKYKYIYIYIIKYINIIWYLWIWMDLGCVRTSKTCKLWSHSSWFISKEIVREEFLALAVSGFLGCAKAFMTLQLGTCLIYHFVNQYFPI